MSQEDLSVVMTYCDESYVRCEDDLEPDDYVYGIEGQFVTDAQRELVGKFQLFYVDAERAINDRVSIFDVLDCHSQAILEYHQLFQTDEYGFSDRVMKLVGEGTVVNYNLLVVDRIEILPKFRGKKLGLKVLHHMMKRFACGAGIVALKPFPLQFEAVSSDEATTKWRADLGLHQMPKIKRIATKKLRDYYRPLGFRLLRGTQLMVRSTG